MLVVSIFQNQWIIILILNKVLLSPHLRLWVQVLQGHPLFPKHRSPLSNQLRQLCPWLQLLRCLLLHLLDPYIPFNLKQDTICSNFCHSYAFIKNLLFNTQIIIIYTISRLKLNNIQDNTRHCLVVSI